MDGGDDLRVVNPPQITRRDRKVGMSQLALYHQQRDPLTRHLDRVHMPELVRREATPNTGRRSGVVQLGADSRSRAWSPACRTAHDAKQPADRQRPPQLKPWIQLGPRPTVHPDLATLIAVCRARNYVAVAALWPGTERDCGDVGGT